MNKNTNLKVKNIHGTSSHRAGKPWIHVWMEATGSERKFCCVSPCSRPAAVGAHVLILDKRKANLEWYLAPFCYYHNQWTVEEEMFIKFGTELIPANKRDLRDMGINV